MEKVREKHKKQRLRVEDVLYADDTVHIFTMDHAVRATENIRSTFA
jgi:hypothetical protein